MASGITLLPATVGHTRLFPRYNHFRYKTYYIGLPLAQPGVLPSNWVLGVNRAGLMTFRNRDHGRRDGSDLLPWLQQKLHACGIQAEGKVVLVTMPRITGYVFNPISFWLSYNTADELKAVLCEVNNTYGESHPYICAHQDGSPITASDWFYASKSLHVSPFMQRAGGYYFKFDIRDSCVRIKIHFYDEHGRQKLVTWLHATVMPFSVIRALRLFVRVPLLTVKVTALIHWQALKLFMKRIRFRSKPPVVDKAVSLAKKVTKR